MRAAVPLLCAAMVGTTAAGLLACGDGRPRDDTGTGASAAAPSDQGAARHVVEQFGERMRMVSVLGPDSIVSRELREAYGALVSAQLLARWVARPDSAPGRRVSSPWPQRIRIDSIAPVSRDTLMVLGAVLYATSADSAGDDSPSERVMLRIARARDSAWRITEFSRQDAAPR